jgi:hypothetical protein
VPHRVCQAVSHTTLALWHRNKQARLLHALNSPCRSTLAATTVLTASPENPIFVRFWY